MSRGLGSKQILALSYMLDRHGTCAPEPIPGAEIRELADRRLRAAITHLSAYRVLWLGKRHVRCRLIVQHITHDAGDWYTLSRDGLEELGRRDRLVSRHALVAYIHCLDDMGMPRKLAQHF